MAKQNALPEVPDHPVRPPEVTLRDEEPLEVTADDGVSLEARIVVPAGARRVIVIAHPHPLYGGTMHNAVVLALAKVASERGAAIVRFNFRGVGKSEGRYGEGKSEIADVIGALRAARRALPGAPVTSVGYSFGSWVSLRAVMRRASDAEAERVALVSPAARIFDFFVKEEREVAFDGPRAIVIGDRDEFCDVDEARAIAAHLGASIAIAPNAEHYFLSGRRRVAEHLAPFLLGEVDLVAPFPAEGATP